MNLYVAIFVSVFLAELGDKTQLATLCYAADGECNPWGVFLASSAALVVSCLLAVLIGSQLNRFIPPHYLKVGAGVLFVFIGAWFVYSGFRS